MLFLSFKLKQTPGIYPHCHGKTLVKAPLISTAIPGGGGLWLQMTSAILTIALVNIEEGMAASRHD